MERSDEVRYVHLRRWRYPPTFGPYATEPAVRAQLLAMGGLTVAYRVNEKKGTATVAVARCNPGDHYCKQTGRAVAAGTMFSDEAFEVLLQREPGEVLGSVIAQVVRSVLAHRQWRGNLL